MIEFSFKSNGVFPEAVLASLSDALKNVSGKEVTITLSMKKKLRGSKQNRYYWGVVVKKVTEMFREHGNYVDEDDVHEFLKLRVGKLAQNVVMPNGDVVKSLGSTTKLSTAEFEIYCDKIRAWAAEYNCPISLPNEI